MKKYLIAPLLAAVLLVIVSCGSTLASRIESFVDKTEKNAPTYDEADWEKSEEKFSKLINEYQEKRDKLSREDCKRINRAIGKYTSLALKSGVDEMASGLEDLLESVPDVLDNLLESADGFLDGLGDFIDDNVDETIGD